eukprot:gene8311-9873_t
MTPFTSKSNPTSKLSISADVSSDDPANLEMLWSVVCETDPSETVLLDNTTLSTPLDSEALVVLPGVLTPGYSYVFTLLASDRIGPASASLAVSMNTRPSLTQGTGILVQTANGTTVGTELETEFTISAPAWTDEDLPLQYQMSYHVVGAATSAYTPLMNDFTTLASPYQVKTRMPEAGLEEHDHVVTVRASVMDSYNALSYAEMNVTVLVAAEVDTDNMLFQSEDMLRNGDSDSALIFTKGLSTALNEDSYAEYHDTNSSKWYLNETDGYYYYYNGTQAPSGAAPVVVGGTSRRLQGIAEEGGVLRRRLLAPPRQFPLRRRRLLTSSDGSETDAEKKGQQRAGLMGVVGSAIDMLYPTSAMTSAMAAAAADVCAMPDELASETQDAAMGSLETLVSGTQDPDGEARVSDTSKQSIANGLSSLNEAGVTNDTLVADETSANRTAEVSRVMQSLGASLLLGAVDGEAPATVAAATLAMSTQRSRSDSSNSALYTTPLSSPGADGSSASFPPSLGQVLAGVPADGCDLASNATGANTTNCTEAILPKQSVSTRMLVTATDAHFVRTPLPRNDSDSDSDSEESDSDSDLAGGNVKQYGTGLYGFRNIGGTWTWSMFEEDKLEGVEKTSKRAHRQARVKVKVHKERISSAIEKRLSSVAFTTTSKKVKSQGSKPDAAKSNALVAVREEDQDEQAGNAVAEALEREAAPETILSLREKHRALQSSGGGAPRAGLAARFSEWLQPLPSARRLGMMPKPSLATWTREEVGAGPVAEGVMFMMERKPRGWFARTVMWNLVLLQHSDGSYDICPGVATVLHAGDTSEFLDSEANYELEVDMLARSMPATMRLDSTIPTELKDKIWATICCLERYKLLPFGWVVNPQELPSERRTLEEISLMFLERQKAQYPVLEMEMEDLVEDAKAVVKQWNDERVEAISKLRAKVKKDKDIARDGMSEKEKSAEWRQGWRNELWMMVCSHPFLAIWAVKATEPFTRAQRILVLVALDPQPSEPRSEDAFGRYRERKREMNRERKHLERGLAMAGDLGAAGQALLTRFMRAKKSNLQRVRKDAKGQRTNAAAGAAGDTEAPLLLGAAATARPLRRVDGPTRRRMLVKLKCFARFVDLVETSQDLHCSQRLCEVISHSLTALQLNIPLNELREYSESRTHGKVDMNGKEFGALKQTMKSMKNMGGAPRATLRGTTPKMKKSDMLSALKTTGDENAEAEMMSPGSTGGPGISLEWSDDDDEGADEAKGKAPSVGSSLRYGDRSASDGLQGKRSQRIRGQAGAKKGQGGSNSAAEAALVAASLNPAARRPPPFRTPSTLQSMADANSGVLSMFDSMLDPRSSDSNYGLGVLQGALPMPESPLGEETGPRDMDDMEDDDEVDGEYPIENAEVGSPEGGEHAPAEGRQDDPEKGLAGHDTARSAAEFVLSSTAALQQECEAAQQQEGALHAAEKAAQEAARKRELASLLGSMEEASLSPAAEVAAGTELCAASDDGTGSAAGTGTGEACLALQTPPAVSQEGSAASQEGSAVSQEGALYDPAAMSLAILRETLEGGAAESVRHARVENALYFLFTVILDFSWLARALARYFLMLADLIDNTYDHLKEVWTKVKSKVDKTTNTLWFMLHVLVYKRDAAVVLQEMEVRKMKKEQEEAVRLTQRTTVTLARAELDSLFVQVCYVLLTLTWALVIWFQLVYAIQLRSLEGPAAEQLVIKGWVLALILDNLGVAVFKSILMKSAIRHGMLFLQGRAKGELGITGWYENYVTRYLTTQYSANGEEMDDGVSATNDVLYGVPGLF